MLLSINLLEFHIYEKLSAQSDILRDGFTNQQFLVFRGVTNDHLDQINHQRASVGKSSRLKYHTDINLLIVKLMPSAGHPNRVPPRQTLKFGLLPYTHLRIRSDPILRE
jgi:hypothetical protein